MIGNDDVFNNEIDNEFEYDVNEVDTNYIYDDPDSIEELFIRPASE